MHRAKRGPNLLRDANAVESGAGGGGVGIGEGGSASDAREIGGDDGEVGGEVRGALGAERRLESARSIDGAKRGAR